MSDGSGNYLVLFSYLALLNTGIAAIARFKAWRPLNLTGFVCTFCIALFWGLKSYTPRHFSTTEPFFDLPLAALYIDCLLIRPPPGCRRVGGDALPPLADNAPLGDIIGHIAKHGIRVHILDHTLLFGTMAAAFALQCGITAHLTHGSGWSAVLFAAVYGAAALVLRGSSGLAVGCGRSFTALRFVVCPRRPYRCFSIAATRFHCGRWKRCCCTFSACADGCRTYVSPLCRFICRRRCVSWAVTARLPIRFCSGSLGRDTLFAAAGGGLLYACWQKWRCEGSAAWESQFSDGLFGFSPYFMLRCCRCCCCPKMGSCRLPTPL